MARRKRPEGTRRPNGTSSIYLGGDGNWHGWVTMGVRDDGKPDRRHVKRKDEGDVIEAVRELEQQRDSGKVRKAGRAWTVEKWLSHWVENIAAPSVRRNTLVGYRGFSPAVYGTLFPGIGAHRINKLQPEHLEALYRIRRTGQCERHWVRQCDAATSPRTQPKSRVHQEFRKKRSSRLPRKKQRRSSALAGSDATGCDSSSR